MEITPKDKAKQLFEKYYNLIPPVCSNWNNDECIKIAEKDHYNLAKHFAFILVDEILSNFGLSCNGKEHYCGYSTIQYYQEVKKEIEAI